MNEGTKIILALLPFIVLLVGFLIFKADALKVSIIVWLAEMIICIVAYDMAFIKSIYASIWGNMTIWNGFLVLWTGQIFGQCFRTTGCLQVLLKALSRVLPTTEGKAITLCSVVGGYLGAFNGFATYPVTIPGLVNLGIDGMRAAIGYLVYFSWSVAFVSLFIGATVAATMTKVPIEQIANVMGLLTIPLVVVSVVGFFKIMNFDMHKQDNKMIMLITIVSNIAAIYIFTQVIPSLYILTLIAGATFSFIGLWLYSKNYDRAMFNEANEPISSVHIWQAFMPLICGSLLVVLFSYPMKSFINSFSFKLSWFGYQSIAINLLNTPGSYVFFTAIFAYIFAVKKTSSFAADFVAASKRSSISLITLFLGGAMVNLMLDTGQITLLAKQMTQWGLLTYVLLESGLTFLAGMAFGQGIPAAALFAKMQLPAADFLKTSAIPLIGISTLVTMGPANPLKPSLLKYVSSLANIAGKDSEMFGIACKWQFAQLIIIALSSVLLLVMF